MGTGVRPDGGDSAEAARSPDASSARRGRWRALGLFAVVMGLSVFEPAVLVGIPLVLMVAGLPTGRWQAWAAAAVAALLAFAGPPGEALWYVQRGWAVLVGGWFVALTLRWPASGFTARGLGAVAGALSVTVALLVGSPGAWGVLDWRVGERLRQGIGTALQAVQVLQGDAEPLSPALVAAVYGTAEAQAVVFPAMVGLTSLAALGVAWWIFVRVGYGSSAGLGPMREFRFNDHLVWLFIGGLVAVVLGSDTPWSRAGTNTVVFMGALYALRGASVVVFLNGGVSLIGLAMLAVAMLFVAPVVLAGALVVGLGDTWLDLRTKAKEMMA